MITVVKAMRCLIHAVALSIGIPACVVIAFLLPVEQRGREHGLQALLAAALIFGMTLFLRRAFRWPVPDLLLGLLAVQPVILVIIGHFSGHTGAELLERFNLIWLAYVNFYVTPPALMGVAIGSVWLRAGGE